MFANPWVLLGLVVAFVGVGVGGFLFGTDYQEGQHAKIQLLIERAAENTRVRRQALTDEQSVLFAEAVSKMQTKTVVVNKEVRHELQVIEKLYTQPLPESSVRVLNSARGWEGKDGSGSGTPADGVPEAGEAQAPAVSR